MYGLCVCRCASYAAKRKGCVQNNIIAYKSILYKYIRNLTLILNGRCLANFKICITVAVISACFDCQGMKSRPLRPQCYASSRHFSYSAIRISAKLARKHDGQFNTLRTGLLNCLNARSRGLTFRHRASCILRQAFRYSPENAFYIFNQQIYFII